MSVKHTLIYLVATSLSGLFLYIELAVIIKGTPYVYVAFFFTYYRVFSQTYQEYIEKETTNAKNLNVLSFFRH